MYILHIKLNPNFSLGFSLTIKNLKLKKYTKKLKNSCSKRAFEKLTYCHSLCFILMSQNLQVL